MEKEKEIKKVIKLYLERDTTVMQKEQILDCLAMLIEGKYHPDNWVEDVGDCEYQHDPDSDETPNYGYNSTTDLDWLREAGIIN